MIFKEENVEREKKGEKIEYWVLKDVVEVRGGR